VLDAGTDSRRPSYAELEAMVGEQVARIAELELVVGELRLRLGQNSEAPWMIVGDSGLPASAGSCV
jgi:hypothetical protein